MIEIYHKASPPTLYCSGCGAQLQYHWGGEDFDRSTGQLAYRTAQYSCPREHWWSLFLRQHHSSPILRIPTAAKLEAQARFLSHPPRGGSGVPSKAATVKEG